MLAVAAYGLKCMLYVRSACTYSYNSTESCYTCATRWNVWTLSLFLALSYNSIQSCNNRPYSKINKSIRAKVAVIFFTSSLVYSYFLRCCNNQKVNLLCIQAHTFSLLQQHRKYIITLNRKWKNNCHFCPLWFIDFWIRSIVGRKLQKHLYWDKMLKIFCLNEIGCCGS
jgi:uncharacterized membrane protein YwzB